MIDALRQCADGRRARREALAHLPGDFGPPVLGHTLKTLASQADFTRGMHARFGLVHRSASFFEEYVMLLGPEANQRVLHRRAMSEPFRAPAMRVYAEQMHDPVARAVASGAPAARCASTPRCGRSPWSSRSALPRLSLGEELDAVARDFEAVLEAAAVAPVALPGSTFARGMRAREALISRLRALAAAPRAAGTRPALAPPRGAAGGRSAPSPTTRSRTTCSSSSPRRTTLRRRR